MVMRIHGDRFVAQHPRDLVARVLVGLQSAGKAVVTRQFARFETKQIVDGLHLAVVVTFVEHTMMSVHHQRGSTFRCVATEAHGSVVALHVLRVQKAANGDSSQILSVEKAKLREWHDFAMLDRGQHDERERGENAGTKRRYTMAIEQNEKSRVSERIMMMMMNKCRNKSDVIG